MTTEATISTMVDRIVGRFQPSRVVLFGSHARNAASEWSDVDLLVVMGDVPDKRAVAVEMRRTLGDMPVGKDIVVTTPDEIARRGDVAGTVLNAALREGKVVYERPEATVSEALRWLRFSRDDLDDAQHLLTSLPSAPRHVCSLSQQAAEKALKAALVLEGTAFPFSHDLDALRNPPSWQLARACRPPGPRGTDGMGGGDEVSGRLAGADR